MAAGRAGHGGAAPPRPGSPWHSPLRVAVSMAWWLLAPIRRTKPPGPDPQSQAPAAGERQGQLPASCLRSPLPLFLQEIMAKTRSCYSNISLCTSVLGTRGPAGMMDAWPPFPGCWLGAGGRCFIASALILPHNLPSSPPASVPL